MGLANSSPAPMNLCSLRPVWVRTTRPSILCLISIVQKEVNEHEVFWGRRGFSPRYLQRDWQKTALFIPLLTPGLKEALSYRISREQVHTEAGSGLQSAAEVNELGPVCAVRGRLQMLCVQCSVPAIPHNQQQFKQGLYYLQELHNTLPASVWDFRFLHSLLGCSWVKEMRFTRINSLLCQTEHTLYQCLQSPIAQSRSLFLPQKETFTGSEII